MKLSLVLPICLSFVIISQAAPMNFDKRRFGVEHTPEADATFQEVKDLAQGSDKEAQAGNLSGAMVRALLAKAPACDQQDRADEIIDLGKEFGGKKLDQFIAVAKTYRQLERNTPKAGQPSELCDKKPRNKELEGLTQAQDPTGKVEDPKEVEDPEKEDPEKEDPEKEDPEKEDPEKEDPEKEDPEKEDPEKEDPEKEDPEKEDPEKEDPEKEDPEKEDPEKEDPEKEDPEKEDPEKEDPEKEDPEKEDPEKEDPEKEDPEKEDPEKEDPEKEDPGTNVAETDPVGGVKMPKIEKKNDDFIVNGNGFNGNLDAAHSRQCDVQKNLCFNKFNGGDKSFSGQDCEDQVNKCKEGPPVFA
ncbi:unnamed protein product [Rhizophagus irregularis]|uniref:Uncharacterized protein n=5 Tax=Rhizophagus irregularis TaxID=588596 RepID=A0A916EBH9_9GLOM|nr:unnamed protein product [Rhizophagus irregularis]CAB5375050.1 unnamed protein product [Rhizophagus irregularis]